LEPEFQSYQTSIKPNFTTTPEMNSNNTTRPEMNSNDTTRPEMSYNTTTTSQRNSTMTATIDGTTSTKTNNAYNYQENTLLFSIFVLLFSMIL